MTIEESISLLEGKFPKSLIGQHYNIFDDHGFLGNSGNEDRGFPGTIKPLSPRDFILKRVENCFYLFPAIEPSVHTFCGRFAALNE